MEGASIGTSSSLFTLLLDPTLDVSSTESTSRFVRVVRRTENSRIAGCTLAAQGARLDVVDFEERRRVASNAIITNERALLAITQECRAASLATERPSSFVVPSSLGLPLRSIRERVTMFLFIHVGRRFARHRFVDSRVSVRPKLTILQRMRNFTRRLSIAA